MRESDLQKMVLSYLKLNHYFHYRNFVGPVLAGGMRRKNPMKGLPDIIMCDRKGHMIGIELKSDKGKLSGEQMEWQEKFHNHGVIYWLIKDFEEFVDCLNRHEAQQTS